MSYSICYENGFANIHNNDTLKRITYIRCNPPQRLRPRGTLILLHDFFKTNYQFRYVVDLFAMAGFITIAPDLPGKIISLQRRPDPSITVNSVGSELEGFMLVNSISEPVHLVGVGMGAKLASMFASKHHSMVASIAVIDAQRSERSEDALKFLSSMSATVPPTVRRDAFARYLDVQPENVSLFSSEDLDEYVNSVPEYRTLLNMQQVYSSLLSTPRDLNDAPKGITSLTWLPEEQPEDFAVAVLSSIRLAMRPKEITPDLHSRL